MILKSISDVCDLEHMNLLTVDSSFKQSKVVCT